MLARASGARMRVSRFSIAAENKKKGCGDKGERPNKARRQKTRWQRAILRARITSVILAVGNPIKSQRRRTRAHHCERDPKHLMKRRKFIGRQHSAQKCKGQRKERMLDFDHLERDAKVPQNCCQSALILAVLCHSNQLVWSLFDAFPSRRLRVGNA